jgi:hypothetical protein
MALSECWKLRIVLIQRKRVLTCQAIILEVAIFICFWIRLSFRVYKENTFFVVIRARLILDALNVHSCLSFACIATANHSAGFTEEVGDRTPFSAGNDFSASMGDFILYFWHPQFHQVR